ncbi:MAG: 30S ribosomal protein S2 [Anaerolineales bacterium]
MAVISMKALLESGVHFGHRTNKWDPRMKPYIFTERNGIHIIDLQQTSKLLNHAYNVVRDAVANGGNVLFVGTKRQAQETVAEEATRCGMPYVTERWMGGMLTNWTTMHARIQELERLEKMRDNNELERLTKKEGLLISREITRLTTRLSGTRSMKRRPDVLFIIDVGREESAVHEANLLGLPIVAMVDTNCNPLNVDYVVPANDDAIRAIKLLVAKIADAVLEGKALRKEEDVEEKPAEQARGKSDRSARKAPKVVETDEELEDVALLGESTLAKLSAAREPVAAAEAPAVENTESAPATSETSTEEDKAPASSAPETSADDSNASAPTADESPAADEKSAE